MVLIVLAVAAPACKRGSPLDTRSIRDWAESEGYAWNEGPDPIRTEEDFFNYIDGAAQPIIDLGWKRSEYGLLNRGEIRLRLAIHEMRTPKAAAALLEQNVFKDARSVPLGDRAVYWDLGLFSKGVFFKKGSLYCELVFEKEGGKDELLGLASSLEARMK